MTMLTRQINPPCPSCAGKVYASFRLDGDGADADEVPQWYCSSCGWRVDKDGTDYRPTYVHYKTPESEVQALRDRIKDLETSLHASEVMERDGLRRIAEFEKIKDKLRHYYACGDYDRSHHCRASITLNAIRQSLGMS